MGATMDLSQIPFFANVSERSLEQIQNRIVEVSYPAKQIILLEHDWGDSVYFIIDGWVRIRAYDKEGRDRTLGILGKNELFGEMSVFSEEDTRSADIISILETTLVKISCADFVDIVRTNSDAAFYLLRLLIKRLRHMNKLVFAREMGSLQRLAISIISLKEQDVDNESLLNVFSHEDYASMCGMSRETVSRVMGRLRKKGAISQNADGKVIPNIEALKKHTEI